MLQSQQNIFVLQMFSSFSILVLLSALALCNAGLKDNRIKSDSPAVPCTCGVFLSGQFKKGSKEQPKGVPVLTQEMDTPFMNNAIGNRQCINKCLEVVRMIAFEFYALSGVGGV